MHEGVATCAVCGASLMAQPMVRLRGPCLRACTICGSWTYLPRPTPAQQAAAHDNEEYFSHPYFALRRQEAARRLRRCRNLLHTVSPFIDVPALRGERWLDVGCDSGGFLEVVRDELGVLPVGIDVSIRAVEAARGKGLEAYQSSIDTAPEELTNLRVVTAIDLIEHVTDPRAFLMEVHRRLRPGGVLYLETPNLRSLVYRFGCRLSGLTDGRPFSLIDRLFPAQHLQYFSPESLTAVALNAGFEVVRLWPRPLPSADISASRAALAAIGVLQAHDRLRGTGILLCAILRRRASNAA